MTAIEIALMAKELGEKYSEEDLTIIIDVFDPIGVVLKARLKTPDGMLDLAFHRMYTYETLHKMLDTFNKDFEEIVADFKYECKYRMKKED